MMTKLRVITAPKIRGEIFCYQAMYPDQHAINSPHPMEQIKAFKAIADPDTMYLHQAMKQHDKNKFIEAMKKEWDDQYNNGNYKIVRRTSVPEGAPILPAVWQMKHNGISKQEE